MPHKVRSFAWQDVRDVIPHRVNLQSRGIVVPYTCVFCDINPENS